jgi:hypothetical protein
MTQHSGLTADRWRTFSKDQQILMIANEMNRAAHLSPQDHEGLRRCYERVLRLVDLTVEVNVQPSLRRELLRWREVIGGLYLASAADPPTHRAAFRCLLQMTPVAAQQIPHVLGAT